MKLANAPALYSELDQDRMRRQLQEADTLNLKRNQDINMGTARVILTSPNGTRFAVTVDNAGALGTTAV